ncbi:hypothetical protein MANES_06G015600v8 [Manihot esculenta]|uniref:Fe2OG dioxygenase domain-containing protein n=1 Tax=Manihot esculenta TaxID=3983 RepID=A0A2C9VLW9_MANES|nr:hypothetical protein MANES_06G015600v8 [Manihot esculenta]
MASETATPLRLPVIDFSKKELIPDSKEWESVKSQVCIALKEYGCFEALFNKVPAALRKDTVAVIEELFELPMETKWRNTSEKPMHGYVGLTLISQSMDNLTNVLWPQGNPAFSKTIQSFSEQVSELDQIVRRMIVESLGLEKYMDEHMNSATYLLRVMKYSSPQTTEEKVGLHPHTDKNFITILCQNQVDGLQVKTKDGEWIDVKLSTDDSFAVMVGDSIFAWTNGLLRSACHRVMMLGDKARYSAGLFSGPKSGYVIKAPDELIDEEHPLLFKPFVHSEFLKFYNTEAGLRAESALKIYCGV